MTQPLTGIGQLLTRISALPSPPAGCVRVFRGQTRDYGVMRPSSLRPGKPRWNRLWDMTLTPLVNSLSGTVSNDLALENWAYWFKVLAQHYGPASPFVDVTTSIDVALWFALHESRSHTATFSLTQGDVAFAIRCPTLSFAPLESDAGWLYVLDAPVWDGRSVPRHGELVELSRGPAFVAGAPRVQRQQGSLMAADENTAGGDLSGFYACNPIAVAHPFDGVGLLERGPTYFFPPPDQDEWYGRLLRAPFIPQPDADLGYSYQ